MENQTVSPQSFFIELMAWWRGQFQVIDVQKQFGVTRQQASKYVKDYEALYLRKQLPGKPFNREVKNGPRLISEHFQPTFISGHVSEYLNWLDTGGLLPGKHSENHSLQTLPLPQRNVQPEIMRKLTQAIEQQKKLDVEYLSLSRPVNDGRIIQPHSFVKTNLRWHVRAYDEEKKRFADFNLTRFRGNPELEGDADKTAAHDTHWNAYITLIFRPDSRLSDEKKAILEQDYQMQNGFLEISTRACLASYLVQELQVNVKFFDKQPEAQQLELVNAEALRPYLFVL